MLLAAVLLAAASSAADGAAVARLYGEACLSGELKLKSGEGKLIDEAELPASLQGLGSQHKAERSIAVAMTSPPLTYVMMKWYANPKPKQDRFSCVVASRRWSMEEAGAAFYLIPPKPFQPSSEHGGTSMRQKETSANGLGPSM